MGFRIKILTPGDNSNCGGKNRFFSFKRSSDHFIPWINQQQNSKEMWLKNEAELQTPKISIRILRTTILFYEYLNNCQLHTLYMYNKKSVFFLVKYLSYFCIPLCFNGFRNPECLPSDKFFFFFISRNITLIIKNTYKHTSEWVSIRKTSYSYSSCVLAASSKSLLFIERHPLPSHFLILFIYMHPFLA